MATNVAQFQRELERDIATLDRSVLQKENELALELLADCRENTPVRTGKLKAAWGIAVGAPDLTAAGGGEELLASRRPGQKIYVQNTDFRATFLENGTEKMAPRPMAAPAILKLAAKVEKV